MSTMIQGHCPQGCGRTLYLTATRTVRCSNDDCPDPDSVHKILAESESEHVAVVRESTISVQHPLRERVEGELFHCEVWDRLMSLDGPPVEPGRWRVTIHQTDPVSESYRPGMAGLDFERLESADG